MHMSRLLNLSAASVVAAACLVSNAHAQSITTLIKEGDTVAGVGTVTGTDGYAVNNAGQWIVEAATNNADPNTNLVLLKTGAIYWRENDPIFGANISSWDDHSLNNNGELFGNIFLRNATTSTDSGIHLNKQPV